MAFRMHGLLALRMNILPRNEKKQQQQSDDRFEAVPAWLSLLKRVTFCNETEVLRRWEYYKITEPHTERTSLARKITKKKYDG